MTRERRQAIGRRSFLLSAGSLAAVPFLGALGTRAFAETAAASGPPRAYR